jgi:hypothetical protein
MMNKPDPLGRYCKTLLSLVDLADAHKAGKKTAVLVPTEGEKNYLEGLMRSVGFPEDAIDVRVPPPQRLGGNTFYYDEFSK